MEFEEPHAFEARPAYGDAAAVVVPKVEHLQLVSASIDPGSGIVACAMKDMPEKVLVYFEGNRNGASNLNTLDDRTLIAYGRMSKKYPTIALACMDANLFEVVGSIDPKQCHIDRDHPAVQAWVAHQPALLNKSEDMRNRRMRKTMGNP